MSTSNELMYAILAMDSYNRGYGAGTDLTGTEIGNAVIGDDSSILDTPSNSNVDESAGFYAVAYTYNGNTIISYRGTNAENASNFWNDAINGYFVSVGSPFNDQAKLAAEFYQEVTGTTDSDPRNGSAILTGHSLGAGLAGFIASLYGKEAVLYDNMPFEVMPKYASPSMPNSAHAPELPHRSHPSGFW